MVFRLGWIPRRYARHCAALSGVRTVRSLVNNYAALLSACPGVRYQSVFIYIHYSETFGHKICAIRVILCHLNVSWPAY